MCYGMGCDYESYPYGRNEGCVCRLPWHATCPFDREEEESESYEDEDEDCEDDYFPRRKLDGEEKYWPEWAHRRV